MGNYNTYTSFEQLGDMMGWFEAPFGSHIVTHPFATISLFFGFI